MPAGVSWGVYLRTGFAAMLSMMAGAQCVHMVYRPMDDLPELIDEYYKSHPDVKRPDPDEPDPFTEAIELNIKKKKAESESKQ